MPPGDGSPSLLLGLIFYVALMGMILSGIWRDKEELSFATKIGQSVVAVLLVGVMVAISLYAISGV